MSSCEREVGVGCKEYEEEEEEARDGLKSV